MLATLLFGWRNWFGMHGSDVLNLVLACVMWIVLKEWDSRMFEDIGSYLDQLKYLLLRSFFLLILSLGFNLLIFHFEDPRFS